MLTENQIEELREAAKTASRHAYCRYSGFSVGAAVLTKSGGVVPGCNVENASYGLTICAERNAIFSAVATGESEILAVGIYTPTPFPTAPCGSCRQVIYEFGKEIEIISFCGGDKFSIWKIEELLPFAFGQQDLGETGEATHDEQLSRTRDAG